MANLDDMTDREKIEWHLENCKPGVPREVWQRHIGHREDFAEIKSIGRCGFDPRKHCGYCAKIEREKDELRRVHAVELRGRPRVSIGGTDGRRSMTLHFVEPQRPLDAIFLMQFANWADLPVDHFPAEGPISNELDLELVEFVRAKVEDPEEGPAGG